MYHILLVDDEALVLAGIKRLVDWKAYNCCIDDTAVNGQEALEKIYRLKPDIVICDIAMPEISGLELLKTVSKSHFENARNTVFILLSNHQDFELAREALRYKAVEYLVKNNLEAPALQRALEVAIAEKERRNALLDVQQSEKKTGGTVRGNSIVEAIKRALEGKISPNDEEYDYSINILSEGGMLRHFAFAYIPLNFSKLHQDMTEADIRRIMEWESEIARKLATTLFPHFFFFSMNDSAEAPALVLFVWNISGSVWEEAVAHFREQLIKTSAQITRVDVEVMESLWYDTLDDSRKQRETSAVDEVLDGLRERYRKIGPGARSEFVRRAKQYIIDHVGENIRLHDVANFAMISSGYLSTLFKKEYNTSVKSFINEIKINRACEMIREHKYRLSEISYKLSFEHPNYFSRVFKQYTGLSPSEYKASSRKK